MNHDRTFGLPLLNETIKVLSKISTHQNRVHIPLCKSLDTFVPKAVVCCCRSAKQAGMGRFLMHQAAFTTVSFDTKYNLHRKPFAPNKFYTGNLLRSFALFFPNVPLFAILFHLSLQLFLLPYWVLGSSLPLLSKWIHTQTAQWFHDTLENGNDCEFM